MLRKPKPIKLSDEVKQAINDKLNNQQIQKVSKSLDPVNFPVFEVPTGKKVLIYVPNHTVDTENGKELAMDKPLIHPVQEGNSYGNYRCISGIVANDANGNVIFNGTCPLCDGVSVPWTLANLRIKQKCMQLKLDPNDKENPQVKTIRSSEFSARMIKEAMRYFTFPIVVINTKNDDGKTPATDADGQYICTPMWYHISEAQYTKVWEPVLEGIAENDESIGEDENVTPGGRFFTLNFIYDTKGKEANKRDAARNLSIIARNFKNSGELKTALDEATKEWTPSKARETVVTNLLYSYDDLEAAANDILAGPTDMINLLTASLEGIPDGVESGDDGFKLSAPKKDEDVKNLPAVDETDIDFDIDSGN